MPYAKPPDKIKDLPKHAQGIWVSAYNSAYEQYDGDEAKANATAWAAVKKAGYYQDEKGNWRKKEAARIVGYDVSPYVAFTDGSSQGGAVPPDWIRVLPLGQVTLSDGRPPFLVTEDAIRKIIEKFEQHKVDMVVDYEHQTTMGDGPAPAAGWVKQLEQRDDGLWAYVQWTDRARDYIKSKEYRYFSPTVRLDSDRRVQQLLHIALTNFPAISGIAPLTLRGEVDMLKEKLNDILGLKDASDDDVVAMVSELRSQAAQVEQLMRKLSDAELRLAQAEQDKDAVSSVIIEALRLRPDATVADAVLRIEGLKAVMERAKSLEAEIAKLKQEQAAKVSEALIDEALKTGRTSPAELDKQDGKLRKLANDDPEFFREFVLGRPIGTVVPLSKLPRDTQTVDGLDQSDLDFLRRLGVPKEQYKQQLERERAGRPFVGFSENI